MKTLKDVTIGQVWEVQQRANLRMQLYLIGETHAMLIEMMGKMRSAILSAANGEGKLDGMGLFQAKSNLTREWQAFFKEWRAWFMNLREQAASLGFGTLAVYMEKYVRPAIAKAEGGRRKDEGKTGRQEDKRKLEESLETLDFIFNPQLQALLDAAQQHIYRDGLNLSRRIWQLDQDSLDGIDRILAAATASGTSAWDTAKELEQYLGIDKDLPRWTRTRLQSLTKKDIAAGNLTGLLRDPEHRSKGVAYNALRLARNETQILHSMATDAMMAKMPWIEKEQINLSPSHPVKDECNDVVDQGEGGQGIYPKGEISLPIHPQCLCFKSAIQMESDDFVDALRGWIDGSQPWPAMDQFRQSLGGSLDADLMQTEMARRMETWAFLDPYTSD